MSLASLAGAAVLAAAADTPVEPVVVVANRVPVAVSESGRSITVIPEATIRDRQALVVSDLLATTPGVGVTRNGGAGGVTAVRIRGAEAEQTLFVIDGVRLNDPSVIGGAYDAANLLVGDIRRIEVLRGVQSAVWGGQAMGGVVSLETGLPAPGTFSGEAAAEAGGLGTAYLRGGVGGGSGALAWRLAADSYSTEGVSAARSGTERDGYRRTGASGRLTADLSEAVRLDLRAVWSDARNAFDGYPAPAYVFADTRERGRTREALGYAGLTFPLADGRVKNRLGLALTDTRRRTYDPDQAVTDLTFRAEGRVERWEYQGEATLTPAWRLTFGAESERSRMRIASPSPWNPEPEALSRSTGVDSAYLQALGTPAADMTLTLAGRLDQHESFGRHGSGQAALAWRPGGGDTLVRASLGQGFRAPSLYQLYSEYGNAGLQPETAVGWDLGLEQRAGGLLVSLTLFGRRTEDQINFAVCSGGGDPNCAGGRFGYYANLDRTQAVGLEASASGRLGGFDLDASYTRTRARLEGQDGAPDQDLARRPKDMASLDVSRTLAGDLRLGLSLNYAGESLSDLWRGPPLKSRLTAGLRAEAPLGARLSVYGRIEDVTDAAPETVRGYGAPGRVATLGLRARF
ncbi:TonB-dependent receptor [Phenylobacterium sp.]|uniref:TonB-dependent receptor plug domain-containing protein n=1 Tax=Phenylobacterium sp. TaxID=1871053 RepID=UPI0025D5FE84|nr:TonB-dependent receptor [Phenylobacterium sp.]MCA6286304.1 TonB-dependent receptor [Phenylobacterium sp.]MCA6288740.1 TonB-dependent receptor [Phenylobacterium sp.]MCA6309049.1 TonB-dependent receptor [Phenylobacterium sp.]MCA6323934.1 TonB-dependent receptor [Phenylobacterium sp.]MCA6338227.1 TonB-dependent receptor [Phenylobacterium sp.]